MKRINIVEFPLSKEEDKKYEYYGNTVNEELRPFTHMEANLLGESLEQTKNYYSFMSQLAELLDSIGNIIYSPILFCKICRILKYAMKKINHNKDNLSEDNCNNVELLRNLELVKNKVMDIIKTCILPSMTLFEANPGAVSLVWAVVNQFNYYTRYILYENWMIEQTYKNPDVLLAIGQSINDVSQFMKALRNDKEIDKLNARQFAKISHSCPWAVLNEALIQLKTYNNLIPVIISAMNYSSFLTLDLLVFLTLRHLSETEKLKLREEDAMIDNWLQNLAVFIATLYKKHYKIELKGVFVYLCNRLASEEKYDH